MAVKSSPNVIFTRHELTSEQFAEMGSLLGGEGQGYLNILAKRTIQAVPDCELIIDAILDCAVDSGLVNVFGVFPALLRYTMMELSRESSLETITIMLWEAHNINRAAEGERPNFEFAGWYRTGEYHINPDDVVV